MSQKHLQEQPRFPPRCKLLGARRLLQVDPSANVYSPSGAELGAVKTCELCKQSLKADLDDFNVNDYYRNHQQSQVRDLK